MIAIQAGRVLTPLKNIAPGTILIEHEKIVAVGRSVEVPIPAGATVIDATDKVVVPGFIDTHTHGRDGTYFGEDPETTAKLCRSIVSTGVTSLLPTLASLLPIQYTLEMILDRIRVVRQVMMQDTGGAEILGIHMEGPYLSSADTARGSQLVANLRKPSVEELHRMVEVSEGTIHKMSIAPEMDGALDVIREMVNMNLCVGNIVRSVGYSLAEAVKMAGLNPAVVIGVDDRKGSLEPGKDADLVVVDEEVEVYMTMVKGQEVYRADAG